MSNPAPSLFRRRTVAILLVVGITGFIGTLLVGAYASELASGRNGGGHALSDGATGYSALVELARATGRNPRIVRDSRLFATPDLLIATPERAKVNISAALNDRQGNPTLFVLPKWETAPDPDRTGWVRRTGLLPLAEPIGVLAPGTAFVMERRKSAGRPLTNTGLPDVTPPRAPPTLQVITGWEIIAERGEKRYAVGKDDVISQVVPAKLTPLLTDGRGGIVLARVGRAPRFVLSDPDLLDNLGMKDLRRARAALAMLDALDPRPSKGIAFDVTFNGLGRTQNPLKLLFEPPFLAVTLTLVAALGLLGISAFARFGPIALRQRAIAYGKAALIDNSAALVRKAGREAAMGGRYAAVVRERAARVSGASSRLNDAALIAYLDSLGTDPRFSDLAQQAEAAANRRTLLQAAEALYAWQALTFRRRT